MNKNKLYIYRRNKYLTLNYKLMKTQTKTFRPLCVTAIMAVCLLLMASCKHHPKFGEEIIVCGDDKVLILDPAQTEGNKGKVIWQWKTSDAADQLPAEYQKLLQNIDECKFTDNNRKIMITASGGGALLLDRATKKCLFYAKVPMAHSIEKLPNNRLVVAMSTHPQGKAIEIYDIDKPEKVLIRDSHYFAHGVVWMPKEKRLYALGFNVIRSYKLMDWNTKHPSLVLDKQYYTPAEGGHDLVPIGDHMMLTTNHKGVYFFDLKKERFSSFELLEQMPNVKSVNFRPKGQGLAYTQADINWWTHHIYLEHPAQTIIIDSINVYKVRTTFKF